MQYSSKRKGNGEEPASTEIDLPSLIAHVRAEELDLACLIVALRRTEASDRRYAFGLAG